jgi:hypothetical protein
LRIPKCVNTIETKKPMFECEIYGNDIVVGANSCVEKYDLKMMKMVNSYQIDSLFGEDPVRSLSIDDNKIICGTLYGLYFN